MCEAGDGQEMGLHRHAYEVSENKNVSRHPTSHLFTVELLEKNPSRNHGAVTSMAAGNNVILVGTDRGWIVRHDFSGIEPLELDLSSSRVLDQAVHRVFIDPSGRHSLAVVRSSVSAETHYIHAKWRKSRILNKMKGLLINTVAWNNKQLSEARDIILGTSTGKLYMASLEEKDKREKTLRLLYELAELREPFVSLQMESSGAGQNLRYIIMGATPTRIYIFTGAETLEAIFTAYADRVVHFTELPGEMPNGEVHFSAKQCQFERFGWLSGPGIYHGELNMRAQHISTNNEEESVMENESLLEYSKISDRSDMKPQSLALTEFHFLVLYSDKLKVVNSVSEKVVEEMQFDAIIDCSPSAMLGLCTDAIAGVVYAFNETSIFEILVHDEGRYMWHVYLDKADYAAALKHCRDELQKERVYAAQAEAALASDDYIRAASFYAKTRSVATFEEVVLKFMTSGEQDALRTFLLCKLDNLSKEERSQITMLSTWATELYLDKISRLSLDEHKQCDGVMNVEREVEYQTTVTEFRAFLSDCKDVLDEATTTKLLGSYGRIEELVYFASLKEQHETVIHHYIQQGDAKKALAVLSKQNVSSELLYKFSPALIMLDAYETVRFWMSIQSLNPRQLIPAIMRYSSEAHTKSKPHEGIKYLEFCIQYQWNEDAAVHNLLLSLYAKQEDESALLRFLDSKYGRNKSEIYYDPKYALRLCLKEKQMRACVYIYSMMNMHEEAVALALQVDPELAKAEADKVEDDPDLKKKLWLMVAKHVIEQESAVERDNIRKAITILKETDSLLKIEDILPFFPDFALIDDFKEAISSCLEDYNKQIEQLKHEMNDATHGAENIRHDINALNQRYAVVRYGEKCSICDQGILTRGYLHTRRYMSSMAPFYVFPCEHAFHSQCLIGYVVKHAEKNEGDHILELQHNIMTQANRDTSLAHGRALNSHDEEDCLEGRRVYAVDQMCTQLDDAVAGECPYCGELMIKEIALPFISSELTDLDVSWEIRRQEFKS